LFEKHRKELQKEIREKTHGLDMDKLVQEETLVNYMVISYCVQDSPFIRGSLCKLHGHIILCPG
jgi:acetyl-CoA carboxylase beta subunit